MLTAYLIVSVICACILGRFSTAFYDGAKSTTHRGVFVVAGVVAGFLWPLLLAWFVYVFFYNRAR